MERPDPDRDGVTGLGPPLFEAPVGDLVVRLHPSEKNGYEWVLRGPGIHVGGVLGRRWEALQVGVDELIIGLAPRDAASAEASVDGAGERVAVHLEHGAYWLVVPLARDVTLTFKDVVGGVVWEYLIPAEHWTHPVLEGYRSDQYRLWTVARYRLGEPLATIRVGDEEVTIHRQEGVIPGPDAKYSRKYRPSPAGRLWGLLRDGDGGPLVSGGNPRRQKDSDPGCVRLRDGWRVLAGTLPPGATWAEARVRGRRPATVELTPEIYYAVVPSTEKVVLTIRGSEGRDLVCHELPPWLPPRSEWVLNVIGDAIYFLDFPTRLRSRIERRYDLPWVRPRLGYSYGPLGWRRSIPDPNEGTNLRGIPPDFPGGELPGSGPSWGRLVALGAALLAAVGMLLWRGRRRRARQGVSSRRHERRTR